MLCHPQVNLMANDMNICKLVISAPEVKLPLSTRNDAKSELI